MKRIDKPFLKYGVIESYRGWRGERERDVIARFVLNQHAEDYIKFQQVYRGKDTDFKYEIVRFRKVRK